MPEINGIPTATHKGEKIVIHFFCVPIALKVTVKCQTLAGGYWRGSRVYDGYVKNKKEETHVFCVSVADSGEGADLFHRWVHENKIKILKYEN